MLGARYYDLGSCPESEDGKEKHLQVVWLDLANACACVPHQLLRMALEMFRVPSEITAMLKKYFAGFSLRFTTWTFTTN